ncbi:MAG: hypothetical protein JWO67_18 [Streptosporangiaceae bacterium]|nr:hypothetical protein [Streptosporangiaceae bacterium]
MPLALAFLLIGGGALVTYTGLTGQPFVPALRDVLAGRKPAGGASGTPTYTGGEFANNTGTEGGGTFRPTPGSLEQPASPTFVAPQVPAPVLAPWPMLPPSRVPSQPVRNGSARPSA